MRGHKSKKREDFEACRGERGSRRDRSQGRKQKGKVSRMLKESDFYFEDQVEESWLEMEKPKVLVEGQEKESQLKKTEKSKALSKSQLETEKSKALSKSQLEEQSHESKTLGAAVRSVEPILESEQIDWWGEPSTPAQATCGFLKTVQATEQEAKEAVERSPRASCSTYLEEPREETRKIASALKKAEDLRETECLCWLQEKFSMLEEMEEITDLSLARFNEQKCENEILAAALRNLKQKFERCQVKWRGEKRSLNQATESYRLALQDMEHEAKEAVERSQASHRDQLEEQREETRKIASALRKSEDLLETERRCWQQEKISLMEEMKKSTALYEARLDEQKCENKTLADALRNVEQKLESHQVEWQKEKTSLIQDMQREAKEAVERSQASHQAQLEKQREETSKVTSALKKAEGLLETERLCWEQEKIPLREMEKSRSLLKAQLEELTQKNETLTSALTSVEQKMESQQVEWQGEKSSLLQATERLKQTLQEWEERVSSMKSQLEDLTRKKKKKAKWYRRIFCLA